MKGASDEIRRTVSSLYEPGDVVEVRAFNEAGWTRSGYFDDYDLLASAAAGLDREGWQVYVTLNPVNAALLARASNRVKDRPKATTSDRDVAWRRWLLVDIDPVRPSGVSATGEEKLAARLKAAEVEDYLREKGWPQPIVADSGNGFHLVYRTDLPNNQESAWLVKGALEALAFRFDDEGATIDRAVHNAARIVRLYGSTTRKGDDTPDRPHRRSGIITKFEEARS